jgi:hypothetical protein
MYIIKFTALRAPRNSHTISKNHGAIGLNRSFHGRASRLALYFLPCISQLVLLYFSAPRYGATITFVIHAIIHPLSIQS